MTFYKSSNEMKTEKKGYPSRKMVGKGENQKSVCKKLWRPIRIIFLSLTIFTLTFLAYLGLYTVLNNMTTPVQTVTVSSEGPAAEIYPDTMGQYNVLQFTIVITANILKGEFWYILHDLSAEDGPIRSSSERHMFDPQQGWQLNIFKTGCQTIG